VFLYWEGGGCVFFWPFLVVFGFDLFMHLWGFIIFERTFWIWIALFGRARAGSVGKMFDFVAVG